MAASVGEPDEPNDPYGRQAAYEAAVAEREAYYRAHGDAEPPPLPNPLSPYVLDWSEFWTADHDETEWLLEPLFADGRAHALYAGAKTGKSYLVLAAIAALATGRPFMGHPGGHPVHCLYVDMEMTAADVHERLVEFGYGPNVDMSHLHYALLPALPPLDTYEGGQALVAAAVGFKARFVVIDTTARSVKGEENDEQTIRAFSYHTGQALKRLGIGWARLDHAGKDASKGQRGTSAKNDDVDVVVRLERVDGGQRLIATHRRMSWYPERTVIAVAEVNGVQTFTTPNSELWPEGTKDCAGDLDKIGVPLAASRREARQMLNEHGLTATNDVLGKALKWRRLEAEKAADDELDDLIEGFVNRVQSNGPATDHTYPQGYPQGTDHNRTTPKPAETSHGPATDHSDQPSDASPDHPASLRSGMRVGQRDPAADPDDPDWCPF